MLNVLNFKKHGKWIGFFAVILIMVSGAVCLTNAYDKEDIKNNGKQIEENKKVLYVQHWHTAFLHLPLLNLGILFPHFYI